MNEKQCHTTQVPFNIRAAFELARRGTSHVKVIINEDKPVISILK